MDTQRLAGILLIAATISIILSTITNAPGLYQTQDIEERMQIIETYRSRWLVNQVFVGVYGILTVAAFILLASVLRTNERGWIPVLGAIAVTIGTAAGLYFAYLQTTDPRGGYSGAYPAPEQLAYWLWLVGQLLFGIALLQSGLPSWIGYLTAGSALLYGMVFFFSGAGFITPFLLGIIELLIGIVLLRQ